MNRTVETPVGRYVEREVRPGVLERTWLDGGSRSRIAGTTGDVRVVDGGGSRLIVSERVPELRATASRDFTIRMTATAHADMEREVDAAFGYCERVVETGGYLYALERPSLRDVLVCHATFPGAGAKHYADRLELAPAEVVERGFSDVLHRANLRLVGDWHLHPNRDAPPSRADRQGWAAGFERVRPWPWVSLLLEPGTGMGFTVPSVRAYVTRHGGNGTVVVEPARFDSY